MLHRIVCYSLQSANLGGAVAPAGDVNGDGFEDVLTSAPSLHAPDNNGAVFLNYGSATGLTPNFSDWSFVGSDGDVLGLAVCAAGDVNGDGYGDFMAGAPGYGGIRPTCSKPVGGTCKYTPIQGPAQDDRNERSSP